MSEDLLVDDTLSRVTHARGSMRFPSKGHQHKVSVLCVDGVPFVNYLADAVSLLFNVCG